MLKYTKKLQVFALILLASALLLAPLTASVKAQGQASIVVMDSVGGTTDPTGTTTYPDGTAVTLTATPGDTFVFSYWEIVTSAGPYADSDNPTTLTVNATVGTYVVQAIFGPEQLIGLGPTAVNEPNVATVVVLAGVGGTTTPAPGTYLLANAVQLNLVATPNEGWEFHSWIIGGTPLSHGTYSFTDTPTDNPYNINHGYGYTYTYQPVFAPVGSSLASPTPTAPPATMGGISDTVIVIALVVVLVIVLIAFGAFAYMKRSKK